MSNIYLKIKRLIIKGIENLFEEKLLQKANVNGVGIAPKITKESITDPLCISVTVDNKVEAKDLDKKDLIPKRFFGFKTDVVPVGELKEMSLWKEKHRPRKVGASACWEGLTACSEGLPIWDEEDPKDELGYTLANNHCISAGGRAKVGDKVLQPSPSDGGTKEDAVGEVTEFNFPVSSERKDNIDMSIYKNTKKILPEDVAGRKYIPETRRLKETDLLKFVDGGGRTLGESRRGQIISIDFTARVYGEENGEKVVRQYKNCVLAINSDVEGDPIVMGGDSSSPRFVDNKPLLQTFAGDPLAAVFNQTQISLEEAEKRWGKKFTLQPPAKKEEGYVAVDRKWLTDKNTKVRLNMREAPGLKSRVIKTLPEGAEIEVDGEYEDGHFWTKVKEK